MHVSCSEKSIFLSATYFTCFSGLLVQGKYVLILERHKNNFTIADKAQLAASSTTQTTCNFGFIFERQDKTKKARWQEKKKKILDYASGKTSIWQEANFYLKESPQRLPLTQLKANSTKATSRREMVPQVAACSFPSSSSWTLLYRTITKMMKVSLSLSTLPLSPSTPPPPKKKYCEEHLGNISKKWCI